MTPPERFVLLKTNHGFQRRQHGLRIAAREAAADGLRGQLVVEQNDPARVITVQVADHIGEGRAGVIEPALTPGQLAFAVDRLRSAGSLTVITGPLTCREDLLRRIGGRLHANAPRQHSDLRAGRLQPYFELRAQHPGFAASAIDHKRLAGVGNLKECGATAQLDVPLSVAKMHGDCAVGVHRYLRPV